jgi:hypothetical protein
MKSLKIILSLGLILIVFIFQGCVKPNLDAPKQNTGILPARFKVDIPSSLSNTFASAKSTKSAYSETNTQADTLKGNEIYGLLNLFIAVGDGAADIVQHVIASIVIYYIDKPMIVSFESDDDHRVKNLKVVTNVEYDSRLWEYELTISDALSENEADSGKAIQIFWNTDPIEGTAILKPYNINRVENPKATNAMFRIDYSEAGSSQYDAIMSVEIANLPMPDATKEPFALKGMKMFVGKKGNNVDVFGNSDHPNAKFYTERAGFSWAFVASGLKTEDIAVAEVGLPPSNLDESDRNVLLNDYSVKNVLTEEIDQWFIDKFGFRPDSTDLAGYLKNADAPGFFSDNGFVQGGIAPSAAYNPLVERINLLSPYNPKSVNELSIEFK